MQRPMHALETHITRNAPTEATASKVKTLGRTRNLFRDRKYDIGFLFFDEHAARLCGLFRRYCQPRAEQSRHYEHGGQSRSKSSARVCIGRYVGIDILGDSGIARGGRGADRLFQIDRCDQDFWRLIPSVAGFQVGTYRHFQASVVCNTSAALAFADASLYKRRAITSHESESDPRMGIDCRAIVQQYRSRTSQRYSGLCSHRVYGVLRICDPVFDGHRSSALCAITPRTRRMSRLPLRGCRPPAFDIASLVPHRSATVEPVIR